MSSPLCIWTSMAFTDHHEVLIGSTDDGHTFVVVNSRLRAAHRLLTQAGFTPHEHHGRTTYLLTPDTPAEEAHNRVGLVMYELIAHTMDFADLSTTRWHEDGLPVPVVRFDLSGTRVTAIAHVPQARHVLEQRGFTPAANGYVLPADRSEREQVAAVILTDAHLAMLGLGATITLGIPTPDDIPSAPGHRRNNRPARPAHMPTPQQGRGVTR
ncbi:hypothetical protein [Streptomyces silvisoli]|uniref:Uncharacterized protein n=1 Tax=Streptomyces silvisoli TaxID=3034235 RepID=A0ABT5ZRE2_9ACTN|nr:hypothetical protein [Streptomyces silvisoli]MDF3292394.1 hypothetical protein [Streptomyces silvisoli]